MNTTTPSHLLMIRPVRFGYNAETAVNNAFQVADPNQEAVNQQAVQEFDAFVVTLRKAGVDVTVVQDSEEPHTPDSIFPNNWVSFHEEGTVVLYPMFAENRRLERKTAVLDAINQRFTIRQTLDFSGAESKGVFLEGTGSMVLDRENKLAFACLSPRTDAGLLREWCGAMGYAPVMFRSVDEKGQEIYHTNVMMCVADRYAVICLDSIPDPDERERVRQALASAGKEIIEINFDQVNHFAGNMLQVKNKEGRPLLVMSSQAYESLRDEQIAKLEKYNPIIHSRLNTIEANGGGSARCMMAEIHLAEKAGA